MAEITVEMLEAKLEDIRRHETRMRFEFRDTECPYCINPVSAWSRVKGDVRSIVEAMDGKEKEVQDAIAAVAETLFGDEMMEHLTTNGQS